VTTKALLLTTFVAELSIGIALLTVPTLVAAALLGGTLEGVAAVLLARLAGIALIAIGVTCFFARNAQGPATSGIVTGVLTYNAAVSLLLMQSALEGVRCPALWPAVAFHLLMATWCLMRLRGA